MPTVVPIRDMRDTARFAELVENSPTPVTVTKNGYGKFVVMRMDEYDQIQEDRAKERLLERMAIAERERAEHNYLDAYEVLAESRKRHGI